jgi:hypothetical protein
MHACHQCTHMQHGYVIHVYIYIYIYIFIYMHICRKLCTCMPRAWTGDLVLATQQNDHVHKHKDSAHACHLRAVGAWCMHHNKMNTHTHTHKHGECT